VSAALAHHPTESARPDDLPKDVEAEAALLGAILLDPNQFDAASNIAPLDFYHLPYAAIFAAMLSLRREGTPLDIVTLRGELDRGGKLDECGGVDALVALGASVPDPTNAPYYGQKVKRAAIQRRTIDASARLNHAIRMGANPDTASADLKSALEAMQAEKADDLIPVEAVKMVDDFPELRPIIIEGTLRETETCNIIASSKVGKTYLALDLALSVATGRRWLGKQVKQGAVLYIDCELHPDTLAKRIHAVALARGIYGGEFSATLDVLSLRGRLKDLFELRSFFAGITKGKYAVIILDALYRLTPAGIDENSNADMTRVYNAIDNYGEKTGAAFVVIHHASKGNQSGKSITDTGAGAGAISRAADSHLILRPHDEDDAVVLESVARSFPPSPATCLRWTYPTWSVDDSLDPEQLKTESRRKPKAEPAPGWTAARFAAEFVPTTAIEAKAVAAKARGKDIPKSYAEGLLRLAESEGLVKFLPRNKSTDPQMVIRA